MDALEPVCPRSGRRLADTRWRDLQMHPVAGIVALRVRHGYSEALGESICPARLAWGLAADQRVSPELEARVCFHRDGRRLLRRRGGEGATPGQPSQRRSHPSIGPELPSAAEPSSRSERNSSAASAAAVNFGSVPGSPISSASPSSSETMTNAISGTENHRQPADAPSRIFPSRKASRSPSAMASAAMTRNSRRCTKR